MKTKTEARREAILTAAKAVFEEFGFEQTTMSEITARVGGSKATLYRYFPSKEALFQALLARSAEEYSGEMFALLQHCGVGVLESEITGVLALLDAEQDVASVLQSFGERVLRTFHTPQKWLARRMIVAAVSDSNLGKMFYENGPGRGMQHLAAYFAQTIAAGYLRAADPTVMANHFRGLVESEVFDLGLLNVQPQLNEADIPVIVSRAVEVFMLAYGLQA